MAILALLPAVLRARNYAALVSQKKRECLLHIDSAWARGQKRLLSDQLVELLKIRRVNVGNGTEFRIAFSPEDPFVTKV